ncbi:MAG: oligosaccharide flippase family protein [Lachnospiraceae bacterium]|nr:oligosaccharide flippase family protein [Lachnospiraceae bacterium]
MKDDNSGSETKNTVKTALLNTIANMCTLIIGVIMIPVITRVIPQSDLGIASTFLANRNIIVIFVTLAVYTFVHKAMLEFADDKRNYIFTISLFCILMVAVAFIFTLPFKEYMKKVLSLDHFLYYWLFVSILAFALYLIADYYCIFHNYSLIVFVIVMSCGPVSQFLSVGLSCVFPNNKYIGRVIGLDAAYVIVSLVLLVWLFLSKRKVFCSNYLIRTLKFSVPVIPHLLSQMVLTQCDLIMISYYAGNAESGIYSMGHTIGYLGYNVMGQIMAVWSPWVYRRLEEKSGQSIYQKFPLMILLGAYISIGLMTISPELICIFLTNDYLPCIYIVPPLVVAMFFQISYVFLYDLEYYYKKPQWIAIASTVAAVLNLILNFIFIKRYGYLAAGYTTVFSYLILLIINYAFAKKLNLKKVYDVKFIWICVVGVVLYMVLMFQFINAILIRYLMLSVISIILILFKYKELISFIKILRNTGYKE